MGHQPVDSGQSGDDRLTQLAAKLAAALDRLEEAQPFAKSLHAGKVLDAAARLMKTPGGMAVLFEYAPRYETSGVFGDSDWNNPERLQPQLVGLTLRSARVHDIVLECLSELRMLAIATGRLPHPQITAGKAAEFLKQVLALNLDYVYQRETEALRQQTDALQLAVHALFWFIVDTIGYGNIVAQTTEEAWRLLRQRPLLVEPIQAMITRMSVYYANPEHDAGTMPPHARQLVEALFGPTAASADDPGLGAYRERIAAMNEDDYRREALAFAESMHLTGLASDYHAVFVRDVVARGDLELLADALGLSETGHSALLIYRELCLRLIRDAVHPENAQTVHGLAMMLERGTLYIPAVPQALWRQIKLELHPDVEVLFRNVYGDAIAPAALLLGGVINVLGQPLGLGQGHNPTCQAARAMAMWAHDVPDYLLQLVTWAARDARIIMHFEGQAISSDELPHGMFSELHTELDPVSLLLVPHLDRIYMEMGRRVAGRGEDGHKWINPEFHGWRTGRGFAIAVDVTTDGIKDLEGFLRAFYAHYHPYCNGGRPVMYMQPAGIAVTDSMGAFVGWHAIAITRVALDVDNVMRVYFFNPNNDSTQDWGQGILTSTDGHGEFFGESSLPFKQFAARLYLFHYDLLDKAAPEKAPAEEIASIVELVRESWGAERAWL